MHPSRSGGLSLALTLDMHKKARSGGDIPQGIVVTARREASLAEMRRALRAIGFGIPIEHRLAPTPVGSDAAVAALPATSKVVNATGLGKDRPGSPLTDACHWPARGLTWEFSYHGELAFVDQARAAAAARSLTVHDGWVCFIHGPARVIAKVFDVDIPMSGLAFDAHSRIAIHAIS